MLTQDQIEEYRKKYDITSTNSSSSSNTSTDSPRIQRLKQVVGDSEKDARESLIQKSEPKKGFFSKIGNALISSENKFGQAISTIGSNIPQQQADQAAQNADNVARLIAAAHNQPDPAKRKTLLDTAKSMGADVSAEEINPAFGFSNKEVIGSAGGVALDVLSAGTYGNAVKGAKTGQLLSKSASISEKLGTDILKDIVKPSTTEKIASFGKGFVKGAIKNTPIGVGYGVTSALQENKDTKGIIKSGIQGGVFNAIVGGLLEGRSKLKATTAPYKAQVKHEQAIAQYKAALGATKEKYKELSDKVIPQLLKEGKWGTRSKLLKDALNGVALSEKQYAELGELQGVAEVDGILDMISKEQSKLKTPSGKILSTESTKFNALEGLKDDITEYISAEGSRSGAATQELTATYQSLQAQKQKLLDQGLPETSSVVKNVIKSQNMVEKKLNNSVVPVADQQALRELAQSYGSTLYDTRKSLKTVSDSKTLSQVQKVDGMIRDILAKANPTYADINKIYTHNTKLVDILNETANRESSGLGVRGMKDLISAVGGLITGGAVGATSGTPGAIVGSMIGSAALTSMAVAFQSTWWNSLRAVQKEKAVQKLLEFDPEKRNQVLIILGREGAKVAKKFGLIK